MKPIKEMTGLELREAVAVEVMGWTRDEDGWDDHGRLIVDEPWFESSIEAAFQVVEKMREKGWIFELLLSNAISNRATASFLGMMHDVPRAPRINAIGDTAPLAICRAAIQAVRAK